MARGKYDAEVRVRLMMTVYAENKEEARKAAYHIAHKLIKRTGAGDGAVIGLDVRRTGSGWDEYEPHKRLRQ